MKTRPPSPTRTRRAEADVTALNPPGPKRHLFTVDDDGAGAVDRNVRPRLDPRDGRGLADGVLDHVDPDDDGTFVRQPSGGRTADAAGDARSPRTSTRPTCSCDATSMRETAWRGHAAGRVKLASLELKPLSQRAQR
jgi:hypothetical protein